MHDTQKNAQPHSVGIVLAGGLGKRMQGLNKPFVSIAGQTMIDRVIKRLSLQVEQLILNTNERHDQFDAYGIPVVADTLSHHAGPLAGILAGLRWTMKNRPDTRFLVSAAVDTPFFPRNLLGDMFAHSTGETIVLASSASGIHPVFALWPIVIADELEAFLRSGANPKVLAFAEKHGYLTAMFESITLLDGQLIDPFFNVNTLDDVQRAQAIANSLDAFENSAAQTRTQAP